jgi:CD63 antigen
MRMLTSHFNQVFAFSQFLQITGLALIITGCVIQGVYSNYLDFLGDSFFNTPVLLVVVGCIIFFITFFGCCGAIKEHHGMTIAFSVLLALILVVELGAGIASYAFRDQVGSIIEHNMEKGLKNYGMEGYKGVTETWNIVQHEVVYYFQITFDYEPRVHSTDHRVGQKSSIFGA